MNFTNSYNVQTIVKKMKHPNLIITKETFFNIIKRKNAKLYVHHLNGVLFWGNRIRWVLEGDFVFPTNQWEQILHFDVFNWRTYVKVSLDWSLQHFLEISTQYIFLSFFALFSFLRKIRWSVSLTFVLYIWELQVSILWNGWISRNIFGWSHCLFIAVPHF